jgi:hypothetical protein
MADIKLVPYTPHPYPVIPGGQNTYLQREFGKIRDAIQSIEVFLNNPVTGPAFLEAANNLSDLLSAATARTNLGLATVAATGAYADLTGSPSLATVATSGAYADLTGEPTLGTAAAHAATDFLSSTVPCFSVNKNGTNQTGVINNTQTLITWPHKVYDRGSHFASNGWTPPAGIVHLDVGYISTGTLTSAAGCSVSIQKNGVNLASSFGSATAGVCGNVCSVDDVANGTDVYTVNLSNPVSSGTATVSGTVDQTFFTGHWICP